MLVGIRGSGALIVRASEDEGRVALDAKANGWRVRGSGPLDDSSLASLRVDGNRLFGSGKERIEDRLD